MQDARQGILQYHLSLLCERRYVSLEYQLDSYSRFCLLDWLGEFRKSGTDLSNIVMNWHTQTVGQGQVLMPPAPDEFPLLVNLPSSTGRLLRVR